MADFADSKFSGVGPYRGVSCQAFMDFVDRYHAEFRLWLQEGRGHRGGPERLDVRDHEKLGDLAFELFRPLRQRRVVYPALLTYPLA